MTAASKHYFYHAFTHSRSRYSRCQTEMLSKSTLTTSERSNHEELNTLHYHRHSLSKNPLQKNHLKQNQNFDHWNTHQQSQKQQNSSIQNDCNHCGAKEHTGNECRQSKTEHVVNAIGHFEWKCRTKERCHQEHAINSTTTEQSNPNSDTDSNNEDIYVFKIDPSTSSKLQSFTISINKNKVNMLIDFDQC